MKQDHEKIGRKREVGFQGTISNCRNHIMSTGVMNVAFTIDMIKISFQSVFPCDIWVPAADPKHASNTPCSKFIPVGYRTIRF